MGTTLYQWHSQATMIDWAICKSAWANLCILCSTNNIQNKAFLKLENASKSLDKFKACIYIEVGVFKTYVRVITLGSLGKCIITAKVQFLITATDSSYICHC